MLTAIYSALFIRTTPHEILRLSIHSMELHIRDEEYTNLAAAPIILGEKEKESFLHPARQTVSVK